MDAKSTSLLSLLFACLFATVPVAHAVDLADGVSLKRLTLIDEARTVKASNGFVGSAVRRIDVAVWYPTKPIAEHNSGPSTRWLSTAMAATATQKTRCTLLIISYRPAISSRHQTTLSRPAQPIPK